MNGTKFRIGERVRALVSVQGLEENEFYTVTRIEKRQVATLTFCTYWVRKASSPLTPGPLRARIIEMRWQRDGALVVGDAESDRDREYRVMNAHLLLVSSP